MNENSPTLYADLRVKTGSYEKDGKTKNRYAVVGVLFASPHFSNMYMQLDTVPISKDWDGRIYVNPREDRKPDTRPIAQHEVLEQAHKDNIPTNEDVEKPINLSDIPF